MEKKKGRSRDIREWKKSEGDKYEKGKTKRGREIRERRKMRKEKYINMRRNEK